MAIVMNKVANKSKRALTFNDLSIGDICQAENCAFWYMKTDKCYDACGELAGNAIRLNDGQIVEFDDTETVRKLKKDLTVVYSNDDITDWYEDD